MSERSFLKRFHFLQLLQRVFFIRSAGRNSPESVSVALGSPGDDSLTLAMMTDVTVTLTGGFLLLHEQTLTMTTMNATSADRRDKTTVSHRDVFTKASGAQTLTFAGGIYQTITLRKRPA